MRLFATIILTLSLILSASTESMAVYATEVDYSQVMITAAQEGNWEIGLEAQLARDYKIAQEGLDTPTINYEELYLLAKIIYAEAGSAWLSDEWKLAVGEVVLNRRDSPEFPNTIVEVLYQQGQYHGADSPEFADLHPDERCANLALKLLTGTRVLNDQSVVFQANFEQGGGVYLAYYDDILGWTYFCYSNYAHMYVV